MIQPKKPEINFKIMRTNSNLANDQFCNGYSFAVNNFLVVLVVAPHARVVIVIVDLVRVTVNLHVVIRVVNGKFSL